MIGTLILSFVNNGSSGFEDAPPSAKFQKHAAFRSLIYILVAGATRGVCKLSANLHLEVFFCFSVKVKDTLAGLNDRHGGFNNSNTTATKNGSSRV